MADELTREAARCVNEIIGTLGFSRKTTVRVLYLTNTVQVTVRGSQDELNLVRMAFVTHVNKHYAPALGRLLADGMRWRRR